MYVYFNLHITFYMKQVATKMQPIVIADIFVVRILLPAFNESSLNINSSSNDNGAGPVDVGDVGDGDDALGEVAL